MAAETGNTYISETMSDSVKIPTANLGFTTIRSSKKVSACNCIAVESHAYRNFDHFRRSRMRRGIVVS